MGEKIVKAHGKLRVWVKNSKSTGQANNMKNSKSRRQAKTVGKIEKADGKLKQ